MRASFPQLDIAAARPSAATDREGRTELSTANRPNGPHARRKALPSRNV
jgi:hypothetical protein